MTATTHIVADLSLPDLLAYARSAIDQGRLDQARGACQQLVAHHWDQSSTWFLFGVTAMQQGDHGAAVNAFEQAVAIRPGLAQGHVYLGQAYQAAGRLEDARAAYQDALQLSPDLHEALLRLASAEVANGDQSAGRSHFLMGLRSVSKRCLRRLALRLLLAGAPLLSGATWPVSSRRRLACAIALDRARTAEFMGDANEAVKHLRVAIASDPGDAAAYARLARQENDARQWNKALEVLDEADGQGAESPDLHVERARALLGLGRAAEARDCAGRALESEPGNPDALCVQGRALAGLGYPVEGQKCYRSALERAPRHVTANFCMGRSMLQFGETEEAKRWLDQAIGADAHHGNAWTALARSGLLSVGDQAFERLLRLIEHGRMNDKARAGLHFAVANVLDRAREYDRAFEHFYLGNRLIDASFSADAYDRMIDDLIAAFDQHFFARMSGVGSASEEPVFIVGLPRSGTSLTEQIIASHPRAFGAGELENFNLIVSRMSETLASDEAYPSCLHRLDKGTVQALADDYLGDLRRRAGGGFLRITDKMPNNYQHLGLIAALFPRARIIHCRRDPMDTCLSIYFQSFEGNHPYSYDLGHLGRYYRAYDRLMKHWSAVLPLPMLELDYEKVVEDQQGMTRQILSFCGLEWDDACLEFHRTRRAVFTSTNVQVRQPIYKRSVRRWKSYDAHLGPLKAALAAAEKA